MVLRKLPSLSEEQDVMKRKWPSNRTVLQQCISFIVSLSSFNEKNGGNNSTGLSERGMEKERFWTSEGERERGRERERQRETQRGRRKETERNRQRERQRKRARETHREREREHGFIRGLRSIKGVH